MMSYASPHICMHVGVHLLQTEDEVTVAEFCMCRIVHHYDMIDCFIACAKPMLEPELYLNSEFWMLYMGYTTDIHDSWLSVHWVLVMSHNVHGILCIIW